MANDLASSGRISLKRWWDEISVGFRRLAGLAGFIGFLLLALRLATDPNHHWNGTPADAYERPESVPLMVLFFVVMPAVVTLFVGWVVAGFRRSKEVG
jgi:hypothetical protein